jgi:hypothetical protein
MIAGTLCLAADSVTYELRKINMRVLRLQHAADFGDPIADIVAIEDSLSTVTKQYDALLCAATNKDQHDEQIAKFISSPVRNELELMLQLYVEDNNQPAADNFLVLRSCMFMMRNHCYMRPMYYKRYLEVCGGDHVKTFTHIMDLFVTPQHKLYKHLVRELHLKRAFCDQVSTRLSAFKT